MTFQVMMLGQNTRGYDMIKILFLTKIHFTLFIIGIQFANKLAIGVGALANESEGHGAVGLIMAVE